MFFRKAAIEKLRQRSEWGMRDLPEIIRVPALEGHRTQEAVVPLEESTIDDLAFAIIGLEAQVTEMRRPLVGLRELYDQARKRGALGTSTVADVFLNPSMTEVKK
jgi:hypothetical protein